MHRISPVARFWTGHAARAGDTDLLKVTAYDIGHCSANSNTRYRIITGAGSLTRCMTFDQDMPGTGCREYTNGGANNGGCVTGSLLPKSVFARAGRCVFFSQPGCQGGYSDSNGPINDCTDASRTEWANIRSFWCAGCECSRRLAVLFACFLPANLASQEYDVRAWTWHSSR